MTEQVIDKWLRNEAEKLNDEIQKIESNIIKKANEYKFDDIHKLNIELKVRKAQQNKLYEMIGRIFELKSL